MTLSTALIASAFLLAAQQPNTVTTTATTEINVPQGTAVFQVQLLDANLGSTLETALTAVASTGASAENLQSTTASLNQGFVVTQYNFLVTVPASEFSVARDKMIATQKVLANSNSQAFGWSTFYRFAEDDAVLLERSLPVLLEKAHAQAEKIATAMGATLGKISSVSTPAPAKAGLTATVAATVTYLLEVPAAAQ